MTSLVSGRLNEGATGPVFYPAAEIASALNEAQRFFVLLTLGLETTSAWSVPAFAANGSIPFFHMLQYFPDWIAPLRIATTTGGRVRPASLREMAALDSEWWHAPGTPSRYASLGADLLGLYQQFAAGGTLNVTYARGPLALATLTDVPEVPVQYHPQLVSYGIYRCRQVEGGQEFAKSLTYLNEFFDGAIAYGNFVRARSLAARYDKRPFELAKFDRKKLLKLLPTRGPAPTGE